MNAGGRARRWIALGCLLAGASCAANPIGWHLRAPPPPVAQGGDEVELAPDPENGFVTLAVLDGSLVKPGTFATADDPAAVRRLWRDLEIDGPVPPVDFAKYVVVVFAELDICHGGYGNSEISALLVRSDGRIRPEFPAIPDNLACDDVLYSVTPTSLYALAVRRDRLGPARRLSLGPAAARRPGSSLAWRGTCEASAVPPPGTGVGSDSILAVPEPGNVSRQFLGDGTPVFVVRHADATLDVFAADTPSWYDATARASIPLRGLREPLLWECGSGRFGSQLGTFDEYGVPVMAVSWNSLDRYRTIPRDAATVVVPRDAREPGYGPRRLTPRAERTGAQIWSYQGVPSLPLSEAVARPVGSRVVVDADLLLVGGGNSRLCAHGFVTNEGLRCTGPEAPALGVAWGSAHRGFIAGSFAARVANGGFSDLSPVEWSDVPEGRIRLFEWQSPKLEGTLSGLGAATVNAAAAGAEASLAARTSLAPRDSPLPMRLVGLDVGVAVRGRWLAGTGRAPGWEMGAGIAPLLEFSDYYRNWTYPTPLGLLVPEVGVGFAKTGAFPYLAWSLPVVHHPASVMDRRHPFGARDVLGLRVAPFALWPLAQGGGPWLFGLSAGVTVW